MTVTVLDRAAVDLIGYTITLVNAGVFGYKNVRMLTGKPFVIPLWVFIYLLLSVFFFFLSASLGTLYLGQSAIAPWIAVGNTVIVFWILTEPSQWVQHVKGHGSWVRSATDKNSTEGHSRQP